MDENDLARMNKVLRHTLRNFASGIKTAMSILSSESEGLLPPRSMEYFPLITNECNRLDMMTRRMNMIFDPVPEGSAEAAGLILEKLLAGLRDDFPTATISIRSDEANTGRTVRGAGSVLAALREAVVNAIEADRSKEVFVVCEPGEEFLIFRVEDHGPGVPAKDHERIFEPFYTTRSSHIGIGLTIVRRLMDALGGKVCARENAGGGLVIELAARCADAVAR